MTAKSKRIVVTLLGILFAMGATHVRAAKAPLSPEKLKKEATHVVTGEVLKVTSKVQKSTVEKAAGIHRDRVFTITVRVKTISKGAGIKTGDQIEVVAWQPSKRIPPLPGLQGHESIPEKGDSRTFFLKKGKGKSFEPLLPNGIVEAKRAPAAAETK